MSKPAWPAATFASGSVEVGTPVGLGTVMIRTMRRCQTYQRIFLEFLFRIDIYLIFWSFDNTIFVETIRLWILSNKHMTLSGYLLNLRSWNILSKFLQLIRWVINDEFNNFFIVVCKIVLFINFNDEKANTLTYGYIDFT